MAEERCDNVHLICKADEDIEDVKVRVWDSPGPLIDDDDEDGTGNGEKYLRQLESEMKEELDVVILCLQMNDTRFHHDNKDNFWKKKKAVGECRDSSNFFQ